MQDSCSSQEKLPLKYLCVHVTYRYEKCKFSIYLCWGLASLVISLGFLHVALPKTDKSYSERY